MGYGVRIAVAIGVRFQFGSDLLELAVLAEKLDCQSDLRGAPKARVSESMISSRVQTQARVHSPAGDCVGRETGPFQVVQREGFAWYVIYMCTRDAYDQGFNSSPWCVSGHMVDPLMHVVLRGTCC